MHDGALKMTRVLEPRLPRAIAGSRTDTRVEVFVTPSIGGTAPSRVDEQDADDLRVRYGTNKTL